MKTCVHCGQQYRPDPDNAHKQRYCSPECRHAYHGTRKSEDRAAALAKPFPCKRCGKGFRRTHGQERYCSRECHRLQKRADQRRAYRLRHPEPGRLKRVTLQPVYACECGYLKRRAHSRQCLVCAAMPSVQEVLGEKLAGKNLPV